ncbi:hypothetical protein DPMN_048284 [Dreissena polymorpha]|uniref:Uncharacterized protein n=1 Tax=Dreissena polymorpha TaxID=45954 RepID=A0A9D4DBA4_DREPO|nr:hypothetical protein DPMN_048284 [Dreissena polymorpha]
MRGSNIDEGRVQVIQELYGNAFDSAVLLSGQQGGFFRTSMGVRHRDVCSLPSYSIFSLRR